MMAAVDEAIRSAHPSHIMYFSSDAVYPFGEEPVSEGSCAEPADLYGAMHLARELVVKSYTACPVVVFRPTLVYGAEDTHNSYGPNRFRRMAIGESEITIFGDGEEMRDHIYIEDVVQLVLMALRRRSRGLLNVATGTSISYAELARKVAERFDKPVGIVSQPRTNPITHRKFDVAARKAAFPDFVPMSLDEGLDQAHHLIAATST
jgi:nucleoside-diphosphate-sugar epimerase